ncbi:hypothetical protein BUH_4318 [Burkholderia pseudomallei Pakistan 9]|nr:hypothetical protein BUH_4318 [Burkholderia pseudomallei Pakistan 9]
MRENQTTSTPHHARPRHHDRLLALWTNVKQLNSMHGTCRHPGKTMCSKHDPAVEQAQRTNPLALSNKQVPGLNHVMPHRVTEGGLSCSPTNFDRAHRSHGRLPDPANARQFRNLGGNQRTKRNATSVAQQCPNASQTVGIHQPHKHRRQ